jgi:D-threo-aldose 1-dehydrogenase
LAHPVVRAVIPGADTPERMRRNIAHMREAIPIDFWQDLKEEKLIRVDAPIPS